MGKTPKRVRVHFATRRLVQIGNVVKGIVFMVVALRGDVCWSPVTHNTSRPRHPRLWRNVSLTDRWYDAAHSLVTFDPVPPATSSGKLTVAYPPPILRVYVRDRSRQALLEAHSHQTVSGSTSTLPWMKVHSIPWLTNSGIFMSRRSSSTSYSIFTYSSLVFYCSRGRRHQRVKCDAMKAW